MIINYEYPPIGGGAAQASRHLALALRGMGHGVAVLTSSHDDLRGHAVEDGVSVYRVKSYRPHAFRAGVAEMLSFILSSSMAAGRIARRHGTGGVIAFFTIPGGPGAYLLKRSLSLPYVVSLRGGDVPGHVPGLDAMHRITGPVRRLILKSSNGIVANSQSLKERSLRTDPFPVSVIPNGVDTSFFIPGAGSGSPLKVLSAGRLHREKNIDLLLDQMEILGRDDGIPFELHVAGEGPDEARLKEHAERLSIRDRIFWHGWCGRERMRDLYRQSACLVNTSLYEGMSNVVLEAMACGLPVIAARVPGNTDLVEDGKTGLLFDLASPHTLRSCIRTLAGDEGLARCLTWNARVMVEKKHSWTTAAKLYLDILQGI
jgi:glycosyltransferase involved in cell wall biosynthesis